MYCIIDATADGHTDDVSSDLSPQSTTPTTYVGILIGTICKAAMANSPCTTYVHTRTHTKAKKNAAAAGGGGDTMGLFLSLLGGEE